MKNKEINKKNWEKPKMRIISVNLTNNGSTIVNPEGTSGLNSGYVAS